MLRTHENGTLRKENVGENVTLVGWVNRRRNLGSLVFIDLRDRTGIVQVTFDETISQEVKDVRNEYILQVEGVVEARQKLTLRWLLVKLKYMQRKLLS